MSESFSLTTDDREQLVAYLDGELPEDLCAAIEDRLTDDAIYRREMQQLTRAWDALDDLPHVIAGEAFVKTTIEMVAVAAEGDYTAEAASVHAHRVKRGLSIAGALAVAAVVGFLISRTMWPDRNRRLLANLPVVERLDVYLQFREAAFLRSLAKATNGQVNLLDEKELQTAYNDIMSVSNASYGQRRQYVDALDTNIKETLASRFARFQEFSAKERQRLRQLHHDVVSADDAPTLIETMTQYMAWLEERSAGERAELRGLSAEKRVQHIGQLVERDRRKIRPLSPADSRKLRKAVVDFLDAHRAELIQDPHIPPQIGKRLERFDRYRFAMGWWLMRSRSPRRPPDSLIRDLYEQAEKALSKETRQYLKELPAEGNRGEVIYRWIGHAFQRGRTFVTQQQLEEFFVSDHLTNDERERLLTLPKDQMSRELEWLYFGGRGGPGRGDGPLRDRRPGGGPPPWRDFRGPRGDRNGGDRPGGPPHGPGNRRPQGREKKPQ